MAEFLITIDFAIISFGVSAYELVAMRIPAIHICLDEDHWTSSEVFEGMDYAVRIKKDKIYHLSINLIKNISIKNVQIKDCNIIKKITQGK